MYFNRKHKKASHRVVFAENSGLADFPYCIAENTNTTDLIRCILFSFISHYGMMTAW